MSLAAQWGAVWLGASRGNPALGKPTLMNPDQIAQWLARLPATAIVAIDEGGLTLIASNGAYLEIGGAPEGVSPGDEWDVT